MKKIKKFEGFVDIFKKKKDNLISKKPENNHSLEVTRSWKIKDDPKSSVLVLSIKGDMATLSVRSTLDNPKPIYLAVHTFRLSKDLNNLYQTASEWLNSYYMKELKNFVNSNIEKSVTEKIASNEEVYKDIDELRQAFDEIVGDEFNIYEVPKNNPPGVWFKKGIYYQFTFESNRIKLYIYYRTDDDDEVLKRLFKYGMIPFYNYLDGNGFKYANAEMRCSTTDHVYSFAGNIGFGKKIMTIWQADY